MPPKGEITGQLFYEINGELRPIEISTVSLNDCLQIVQDVESAMVNQEFFKGGEITVKMSGKTYRRYKKIMRDVIPTYYTNNWRKMHGIVMVRKSGVTK